MVEEEEEVVMQDAWCLLVDFSLLRIQWRSNRFVAGSRIWMEEIFFYSAN